MHNRPHPGEINQEDCLNPLGLTFTTAAAWLGVSRQIAIRVAQRPREPVIHHRTI